jgi:hypothetical protein
MALRAMTGPVGRSSARAVRAFRLRAAGVRAFIRAERSLAGWDRTQRTRLPTLAEDRVPVIFCTWRRLERLPHTLAMLAAQDTPVQALIWNNNPDQATVDEAVARAEIPVVVHHNPRNIGGFGRFYLAREAGEQGHDRVVFIDDDQDFKRETVSNLLAHHCPHSLSGWWAFRLPDCDFWNHEEIAPGEIASYVGTGGMVADTAVFRDARLFGCPRRFYFVEDLWLCYFANHIFGYKLFKTLAQFELIADDRDQFPSLAWVKERLMRWLVRQGWEPPGARVRLPLAWYPSAWPLMPPAHEMPPQPQQHQPHV